MRLHVQLLYHWPDFKRLASMLTFIRSDRPTPVAVTVFRYDSTTLIREYLPPDNTNPPPTA
jgi:hypothetical protein